MEKILYTTDFDSRDALLKHLEEVHKEVEIIIIDEKQFSSLDKALILQLRFLYPTIRIIYIFDKHNQEKQHFLYTYHVFDLVLVNDERNIQEAINHPKKMHDVAMKLEVHSKE